MIMHFKSGWQILQDVHDAGDIIGFYKPGFIGQEQANQVSEWEDLPELKHLQLIYAQQPYFGRELRYFNQAPWWYKQEFDVPAAAVSYASLRFTNVDYYCKIWLNGHYVGEHEGYSIPFRFRVEDYLLPGQKNVLTVKVWSPWDKEILNDRQDRRTFMVMRNLVKGTYEHSDTFVQRDANPVGIYGDVTLEISDTACFAEIPEITYTLSDDLKDAKINAKVSVAVQDAKEYTLRLSCTDHTTKETVCVSEVPVNATGDYVVEADAKNIRLWNTWDKGGVWLYDIKAELLQDGNKVQIHTESQGFRKIEMVRDKEKTRFFLNGKAFYVRGTSYFPDLYVSNMCYERYKRDLLKVKAAGFNFLRIHVHVALPMFYELCTELGLGIMQDSEYNWTHPTSDEYADRFIRVYLDTVKMLKRHSSVFCWGCMNEPGFGDPVPNPFSFAMTVNPGPRLYQAVTEMDPSRPAIKGSYCEDDPCSGDSHNYTGSLTCHAGHYSDIYGTTEKLNTEYGFDAPPCLYSLRQCPPAYKRLQKITDRFDEIGEYQYKLLKYYTEHYRIQKYAPNSGYVHFLFNDMCPQSFYGIYDWWGLPKKGLDAMLESNMPLGVFLKYSRDHIDGIYAVNDDLDVVGDVQVKYVFTDESGNVIASGTHDLYLGADTAVHVCDVAMTVEEYPVVNCALLLMKDGQVLHSNHYEDLFHMPEHVEGHPERMSHEVGIRLYFA